MSTRRRTALCRRFAAARLTPLLETPPALKKPGVRDSPMITKSTVAHSRSGCEFCLVVVVYPVRDSFERKKTCMRDFCFFPQLRRFVTKSHKSARLPYFFQIGRASCRERV